MHDFYLRSPDEQLARMTSLASAALPHWQGSFELTPIKYRENAVFAARGAGGVRAALRVHRHAYHSDAALASELMWMEALSKAGIPAPALIRTSAGGPFATVSHGEVPEPRQVDMLTWLDGETLGSIENGLNAESAEVEVLFRQIGGFAARLHDHGTHWRRPATFVRHAWDAEGLLGEQPLWGRFWELPGLTAENVALLLRARDRAALDLERLGKDPAIYGLVHADLIPENLLNDRGTLKIVDFDDCGFGWFAFELATVLYFHVGQPYYGAAEAALFEGYQAECGRADVIRDTLPLFLMLRGMSYIGWTLSRQGTQTAREMGPLFVSRTLALCAVYLAGVETPA